MADRGFVAAHYFKARWREAWLRGDRLAAFQERRGREIVEFARRSSPYYRKRLEGLRSSEWRTIPPIGKAEKMANFSEFNTVGIGREEAMRTAIRAEETRDFTPTINGVTVGLSSGTSGHRGLFLAHPREQAAWAGIMLARGLPGLRPRGYRIALFLRSNSNLYEKIGSRWIQFQYFDLMTPLNESVARLNDYCPDILVAPPSMLSFLANARERGVLAHTPIRIFSAAEVLEPQDRARIEAVFQQPLHQIYQCTEGFLAITCRCARLHIQEDLIAMDLEQLPLTLAPSEGELRQTTTDPSDYCDDTRNPKLGTRNWVADAPRLTPIVTDLWRTAQPIIRYRMNDILSLDPLPCPCGSGFRVIAEIEGRCDDIVYFCAESGALLPVFPDTIRRMALLASDAILDYQAVQREPGEVTIFLHTAPGRFDEASAAVRETMQRTAAQYGCRPLRLTVESGLLPRASGAKRRRVQRLIE